MRRFLIVLGVSVAVSPLAAYDLVATIDWQDRDAAQTLPAGALLSEPESGDGPMLLVVDHQGSEALELTLAVVEGPAVNHLRWAISGELRYQDVVGDGYLEMLSCFPGGDCHFSRSVARSGPLAKLHGSSHWRPVVLPFFSTAEAGTPQWLELRLVLPGSGKVILGPMRIFDLEEGDDPMMLIESSGWWSDRTGAWIAAIVGSVFGLMGAVIGVLGGRGKSRRVALASLWVMVGVGSLMLSCGAVALFLGQPYGVWYPLLLVGFLLAAIGGGLLPVVARRYGDVEERRMRSMDS